MEEYVFQDVFEWLFLSIETGIVFLYATVAINSVVVMDQFKNDSIN
jgi:hypothetical protein